MLEYRIPIQADKCIQFEGEPRPKEVKRDQFNRANVLAIVLPF